MITFFKEEFICFHGGKKITFSFGNLELIAPLCSPLATDLAGTEVWQVALGK